MKKFTNLFLSLLFVVAASAQDAPPNTDIYLISADNHGNHWHFSQPKKITENPGYDNQPYFMPKTNQILFSSMRDGEQTDIYAYLPDSHAIGQINTSKESEYSPVLLPDGESISVVRVEADGKTQRLWKINVNTKKEEVLLPEIKNVGYYAWLNEKDVVLFLLGETFDLYLGDTKTGKVQKLDENIGRSIQKVPGENAFSYVIKKDSVHWVVMKYNLDSKSATGIIPTLSGSEDYAFLPDGTLLMGKEGKLYHHIPGSAVGWQMIQDFSGTAAANFYRIAVSPDGSKIALVVNVKNE